MYAGVLSWSYVVRYLLTFASLYHNQTQPKIILSPGLIRPYTQAPRQATPKISSRSLVSQASGSLNRFQTTDVSVVCNVEGGTATSRVTQHIFASTAGETRNVETYSTAQADNDHNIAREVSSRAHHIFFLNQLHQAEGSMKKPAQAVQQKLPRRDSRTKLVTVPRRAVQCRRNC